jgi:hypothetical protein
MAWNDEHAGVAAAPPAAIDWSVAAMSEAAQRLSSPDSRDLPHLADAVADAVWWVTLVDATLVRYHPQNYESTLGAAAPGGGRPSRPSRDGRYVRNQLGRSVNPADLITPAAAEGTRPAWTWRSLPQPDISGLGSRARRWELSRYNAYQARLAGRDITVALAWCAEFLALAARLAGGEGTPS